MRNPVLAAALLLASSAAFGALPENYQQMPSGDDNSGVIVNMGSGATYIYAGVPSDSTDGMTPGQMARKVKEEISCDSDVLGTDSDARLEGCRQEGEILDLRFVLKGDRLMIYTWNDKVSAEDRKTIQAHLDSTGH